MTILTYCGPSSAISAPTMVPTNRVTGSDPSEKALDILKQLKVRNDGVAVLRADQGMPRTCSYKSRVKH
jgi:hypothetical protein